MSIIIQFPDNNKEYEFTKNDAIQSVFIKNYLENLAEPFTEEKDETKDSQLMNETIFFKKKKNSYRNSFIILCRNSHIRFR